MECDKAHVSKDSVIMRTFLHGFLACGFGLVFCLASSAQSGFQYQSPAKWDNFHPERETLQRYVLAQVPDDLPPPDLREVVPGEPTMETVREIPGSALMPPANEEPLA